MRTIRTALALLMAACASRGDAPVTDAPATQAPAVDSVPKRYHNLEPDSLLSAPSISEEPRVPGTDADAALDISAATRRLGELEAMVGAASTDSAAASTLLRAGVLKIRLYAAVYDSTVAKSRPTDFFHNEIAGGWLYNGRDLDALLARYPQSDLADEARYAKLFLILGGECEGRLDCYLRVALDDRVAFLKTDPQSPLAERVVAAINDALATLLPGKSAGEATLDYDPAEGKQPIREYQAAAMKLPPALRRTALSAIARAWEEFDDPEPARAIVQQLVADPGIIPPDSIRADLTRLDSLVAVARAEKTVRPEVIPADVRVACDTAAEVARSALGVEPARADGRFRDSFKNLRRIGCRLTAKGSFAKLKSMTEHGPDEAVGLVFEALGWRMDNRYSADSEDGSYSAFRTRATICLVMLTWVGDDHMDTTARSRPSDSFDVRIECVREGD